MPKYLECVACGEKFKNLRSLSAHKRLAHGILTGEKQEIKDSLGELGDGQSQILNEVREMVKTNVFFNEHIKKIVGDLDERLKSIEEMLDGLEKDLTETEGEEIEEVPAGSNPINIDKLKQDLKAEIKKELDEEKIKAEEDRRAEEEKKKKEDDDKSIFM